MGWHYHHLACYDIPRLPNANKAPYFLKATIPAVVQAIIIWGRKGSIIILFTDKGTRCSTYLWKESNF